MVIFLEVNEKAARIEDIREASAFLREKIERTPMIYSRTFSDMFGAPIYLKLENFQKTGSFKTRGALFKMSKLSNEEKSSGVVAASAGNHAQGVAFAAKISKISCKIVMPTYTISAKINAVKNYGAEVVLKGDSYKEAFQEAKRISVEEKRTFIDGFNDRWIISGQGTIGLEILEDLPSVKNVIVPVGGGGLISGISAALKESGKDIRVYGVQSENCDCVIQTMEGNPNPSSRGFTIADGIAVQNPGDINIWMIQKYVDRIVTVNDEQMAYALFKLLERQKIVVEASGAAPLASLMSGKIDLRGEPTVLVVSGGNIDLLLLSKIIYKGMETDMGLIRIECKIPDRPGTLHRITSAISMSGANIFHAEVDNLSQDTPVGYQSIRFSVNVRDGDHLDGLLQKLSEIGYHFHIVKD
ncbi:threonine ammonia-lyase [Cuniculiplasma sp. SKW3]|uniref:threonine ammonia-lyase n=1 Tax=Cuniculiplasma sp. SKW3 TaxID=3400170 RepID=UPI003FD18454